MSDAERQEYRIVVRGGRVAREMERLPGSDHRRVVAALRSLSENPRRRGVIRLRGNTYRFRVGDFRIIYRINDSARSVVIGAVRRRNEGTYRDFRRLF